MIKPFSNGFYFLYEPFHKFFSGTTAEEYIDFDIETCTSSPVINSDKLDWRTSSVQKCVSEYLTKEAGNTCVEEVSSDDEGGENIEEKEKDLPNISTYEALAMID